jgi:hypothetical protein
MTSTDMPATKQKRGRKLAGPLRVEANPKVETFSDRPSSPGRFWRLRVVGGGGELYLYEYRDRVFVGDRTLWHGWNLDRSPLLEQLSRSHYIHPAERQVGLHKGEALREALDLLLATWELMKP